MQYAPTIFTTMLSFLRGNANNYLCIYLWLKRGNKTVSGAYPRYKNLTGHVGL